MKPKMEIEKFNEVKYYEKVIGKVTCVTKKDIKIIYGRPTPTAKRTQEREKHLFRGLKEDQSDNVVLIECPLDDMPIEFEQHSTDGTIQISKDKIQKFIAEAEKKINELGLDYCVCDHEGTSPYIWICNLKGLDAG